MLPDHSDNRLPRAERLRGSSRVAELFADGDSHFAYPIRYVVMEEKESMVDKEQPIEVMFNVPKRFHRRANKRNLLRRRIKEAYRLGRKDLKLNEFDHPLRVAMIYSTKDVLEYAAIEKSMAKIFKHLNEIYGKNE